MNPFSIIFAVGWLIDCNRKALTNLMAAMKAAEAKRTADETWERLAPPLQKLNKEDKQKLYDGLSKIFA